MAADATEGMRKLAVVSAKRPDGARRLGTAYDREGLAAKLERLVADGYEKFDVRFPVTAPAAPTTVVDLLSV